MQRYLVTYEDDADETIEANQFTESVSGGLVLFTTGSDIVAAATMRRLRSIRVLPNEEN